MPVIAMGRCVNAQRLREGGGRDERSILGTGTPTPSVVLMIAVMGFCILDSDYVKLLFGEAKLAGRVVNGRSKGKQLRWS